MKTIAIIKNVFVLNMQVKVFESVNESLPRYTTGKLTRLSERTNIFIQFLINF